MQLLSMKVALLCEKGLLLHGSNKVADFDELGVVWAKALLFHALELLPSLSAVLGSMMKPHFVERNKD